MSAFALAVLLLAVIEVGQCLLQATNKLSMEISNTNSGTPIQFGLSGASVPSTLVVPNRQTNTDPI